MAFDPTQPFESVDDVAEKPAFDPSQPFEPVEPEDPVAGRLDSMHKASTEKPENVVRYNNLAKQAGVSYEVAKTIPDQVERQIKTPDWREFTRQAPNLSRHLSDNPQTFEMAKDDLVELKKLEEFRAAAKDKGLPDLSRNADFIAGMGVTHFDSATTGSIENTANPEATFRTFMSGLGRQFNESAKRAGISAEMLIGRALGLNDSGEGKAYEQYQMKQYRGSQSAIDAATPEFDTATGRFVFGGVSSAVQTAPTIAIGMVNPVIGLGFGGAQSGLLQAGDILERGGTTGEAVLAGAANAVIEIGTEMIPIGFAAKTLGKMRMIDFVKGFAGREMIGEQIATLGQDAIDTAIANPDKTWEEYWKERPEAAVQTMFAVGATSTGMAVLQSAANRVTGYAYSEQSANNNAGAIMGKLAAISNTKLAKASPETMEQLLDAIDGNEQSDIFIDPASLFQGAAVSREALLELVPDLADQLADAEQVGGLVSVRANKLMVALANADPSVQQEIVRHVKSDPGADSLADIESQQSVMAEELNAMAAEQIAKMQDSEAYESQRNVLMEQDIQRLQDGYRMTPEAARTNAMLRSSVAVVNSQRAGISLDDFYSRFYSGRMTDERLPGQVFNQDSGIESVRQSWVDSGIDGAISERGDLITVSKIVVPEDMRGNGDGTKAMQRLIEYADATGKHIALSPSTDFGGDMKRLKKFYKGLGFVENKGKDRAFSTMESMYRKAPGKVLYQGGDGTENINKDSLFHGQTGPRGAFNPATRDIAMYANADLSTFLHESGHLYLEIMSELAGLDTASDGIKSDMDALLQWFGITGDTASDRLTAWKGMTLEQQRQFHEQFAESFEQYLLEGKAPSVELRDAFRTFRQWMLHVYKSLQNMLKQNGNAKLNDEVRAVFDRMLATEEQIRIAETAAGRALTSKPSFMTDAEWRIYQDEQQRAHDTAVEELQARSLRDLKYASNATTKRIKEMQKEASRLRREARMEARKQIMSQPVYRAWQFLTAPIDGVKAKTKKSKANPNVDPSRDSLFTAIAKLGGLNKSEAESQFGIDPKDYLRKGGVFGKPVLRKEGGLSPDAMAEALSQFGYMRLDDNGKWDVLDLDDMLRNEAAGDLQYSNQADYDLLMGEPEYAKTPDGETVDYVGGRLSKQAVREMLDDIDLQAIGIDPAVLNQPAYHGSPYRFDKFSLEHMGKGEGVQAYGWGLYFAGSKDVAEYYRQALTVGEEYVDGEILDSYKPKHMLAKVLNEESGDVADAEDSLRVLARAGGSKSVAQAAKEALKLLESGERPQVEYKKPDGQLYKVDIPEDNTFLLWDRPMSEQPKAVIDALVGSDFGGDDVVAAWKENGAWDKISGKVLYGRLSGGNTNAASADGRQQAASKFLHSLGINGIKYLDGTSRSAGEGNYNYVVFDDNAIQILETFYQPGTGDDAPANISRFLSDEGMHPDAVAGLFGFANGTELLKALSKSGDPVAEIEKLTDQLMMERHADLATPEAIKEAAAAAVHNKARSKFLATQYAMLSRAVGDRRILMRQAKDYAQRIVSNLNVKDLKPARWEAQEAKAGSDLQKAMAKGNTQAAAMAARNQVLHNATVVAIREAQEDVAKARKLFTRIANASDAKQVSRGRDPDVVNAIRAILAQYDIFPAKEKQALEYLQIVEQNDPEMYNVLRPAVEQAMIGAKPWNKMTYDEFMGMVAEVDSLWYMAKRSRQMEVDGNRLDMEDAADQLVARMTELPAPAIVPGQQKAMTTKELALRKLQYAGALLRRVEQWAEAKDGKFGGPFLRLIFQPVKDAADRYRTDRTEYRKRFKAIVESMPKMKQGIIAAPELGYTFGAGDNKVGMSELLHAILHTGNSSNKRKLLLGRQWASLRDDGSLDTGRWDAFVNRLVRDGTLRREHFDFAQGVWDLLEETKPMAQKTHREVFGRYFDEVTADPFGIQFPDGTVASYRGGYVPAQADGKLVGDAARHQLAEQENQSMAYAFPATAKGFTKARVEDSRPLVLDLHTLPQHLDKVLLFSHLEPRVRDVARLLKRSDVSSMLYRIDPTAVDGMLMPWLNRAARQVVEVPVDGDGGISRIASVVRSRAGMALMFGNVSNTLQQITGFVSSLTKVDAKHLRRSMAGYVAAPKATADSVAEASLFMRDRMQNEIAAINGMVEEILFDPSLYKQAQNWTMKHAYFLQTAMDNVVGPIIWTAAYNQAVEHGHTDADAVRFADGVIRQTQGSTLPEDVSRFETGPAYARVFTQFVGYFNMVANTNVTELQKIMQDVGLRKGAGRALGIVVFGVLAPAWVAEAIAIAMRGGPDDEDDDGYIDDWIAAVFGLGTIRFLLAGVPVVGQFATAALARANNNPTDDRVSLSPAVSLAESSLGVFTSVPKAVLDDGDKRKAVNDVATLITLATGLPAKPLARPLGYLTGVADDRIDPTNVVDFARGVVTGTPSPESRVR